MPWLHGRDGLLRRCGLDDWNTFDLTLAKSIRLPKTGPLSLKLSVYNMFDHRYEVSSGYPMPGRSILGGLEYKF